MEDNPNESLDSELLIPRDELCKLRDMVIKTYVTDANQISGNGTFVFFFFSSRFLPVLFSFSSRCFCRFFCRFFCHS